MNRDAAIGQLRSGEPFDVVVVGGGATGLGTALDAASRGLRTAILEQHDFGKATSSRSTKLAHGGVRYLRQGNLGLVRESLRERGRLRRNAPHLVHVLPFVIPAYRWWEKPYYGTGLKLYDLLARDRDFHGSRWLSRQSTLGFAPTLAVRGLSGGIEYTDGQFDDARLLVTLAQTLVDHGGVAVNYVGVVAFHKQNGRIAGVEAVDSESGESFRVPARVVVNATGVFSDAIRRLDEPAAPSMLALSRGTHLVLDRGFLPGDHAVMIPATDDGRVLFAIPWLGRVLAGTTEQPVQQPQDEPRADSSEITFLLEHLARYLNPSPELSDVRSVFTGIRPLVSSGRNAQHTEAISRDHHVSISASGLVTVAGGKWTTYRQMGEDAVDTALRVADLDFRPSKTRDLRLHGWSQTLSGDPVWDAYGTDSDHVRSAGLRGGISNAVLHPSLPYTKQQVLWAARDEMARTVEDVLARRTRSLLLDAAASAEYAPEVARLLATELDRGADWERDQVRAFRELAAGYLPEPVSPQSG